jgi:uncharacterized membrane protein YeaQ/YmgE (transglycosylase-associated protein family)
MYELIPIFAGAAAGLLAMRLTGRRSRAVCVAAIALVAAVVAGLASGELEESPAFLIWDTAQAVGAAVLVMLLVAARSRAAERHG